MNARRSFAIILCCALLGIHTAIAAGPPPTAADSEAPPGNAANDCTPPEPTGDPAFIALCQAASAGDDEAQFELGARYLHGNGVSVDNFEALHWLKLAADAGNTNAQYNIAVMYLNGLGVVPDAKAAVEWFLMAAENGDPQAQLTLAILMFNGQLGVEQNTPQAYKWFLLAGAAGNQTAAANAVLLQELLPPNVAADMQAEALDWIASFQQSRSLQDVPIE